MAFKIKYNDYDKERIYKSDEYILNKKTSDFRTDFERDRSRIIHSSAFRRLQGKTQIMSPGYLDFYRNRLTHSLEVAQISRGIAIYLGIEPTLVEAIALAHDIGHPPLGHSGERKLMKLMEEYGGFEANAQNIRILTYLETKTLDGNKSYGLNLTRALLDGVIKYKQFLSTKHEKGIYEDNKEELCFIDPYYEDGEIPIEAKIMDWADDIAYSVHDIEDGIKLSLINLPIVEKLAQDIIQDAKKTDIDDDFAFKFLEEFKHTLYKIQKGNAFERKRLLKNFTSSNIHIFIKATRLKEHLQNKRPTERYNYTIDIDQEAKQKVSMLKTISKTLFINDYRLEQLRHKLSYIIEQLFMVFSHKDAYKYYPDDFRYIWKLNNCEDNKKNRYRVACDYISGMTDNFALKLYRRLFSPTNDGLFDIV